jgi:hypothetical protein
MLAQKGRGCGVSLAQRDAEWRMRREVFGATVRGGCNIKAKGRKRCVTRLIAQGACI